MNIRIEWKILFLHTSQKSVSLQPLFILRQLLYFCISVFFNPPPTKTVPVYQPRPVQYNTTYPLKPGSACELIYTSYIGLYAVLLLLVNFGHFFFWEGVPSCPNHLLPKRNSTIGIRKVVETGPTRSTSLPVFLAAPVFFSSSLSSPSLSVSWSEFLENYILRTPLGNNFLHMTKW